MWPDETEPRTAHRERSRSPNFYPHKRRPVPISQTLLNIPQGEEFTADLVLTGLLHEPEHFRIHSTGLITNIGKLKKWIIPTALQFWTNEKDIANYLNIYPGKGVTDQREQEEQVFEAHEFLQKSCTLQANFTHFTQGTQAPIFRMKKFAGLYGHRENRPKRVQVLHGNLTLGTSMSEQYQPPKNFADAELRKVTGMTHQQYLFNKNSTASMADNINPKQVKHVWPKGKQIFRPMNQTIEKGKHLYMLQEVGQTIFTRHSIKFDTESHFKNDLMAHARKLAEFQQANKWQQKHGTVPLLQYTLASVLASTNAIIQSFKRVLKLVQDDPGLKKDIWKKCDTEFGATSEATWALMQVLDITTKEMRTNNGNNIHATLKKLIKQYPVETHWDAMTDAPKLKGTALKKPDDFASNKMFKNFNACFQSNSNATKQGRRRGRGRPTGRGRDRGRTRGRGRRGRGRGRGRDYQRPKRCSICRNTNHRTEDCWCKDGNPANRNIQKNKKGTIE